MRFRPGHAINHHREFIQDEDDRFGRLGGQSKQLFATFLPTAAQLLFELDLYFQQFEFLNVTFEKRPDFLRQSAYTFEQFRQFVIAGQLFDQMRDEFRRLSEFL